MDYAELLKKAKSELPEELEKRDRFEIPKPMGHIQGNVTVISNFGQIAKKLNREQDHMMKFVLKEIAAPGKTDRERLMIGRKISAAAVQARIKKYCDTYVMCQECGSPDTALTKDKGMNIIKCQACGAKYPVRLI